MSDWKSLLGTYAAALAGGDWATAGQKLVELRGTTPPPGAPAASAAVPDAHEQVRDAQAFVVDSDGKPANDKRGCGVTSGPYRCVGHNDGLCLLQVPKPRGGR